MATAEETRFLGALISQKVFEMTGYEPSVQISREFAMKVLAESRVAGYQIPLSMTTMTIEGTSYGQEG